MGEVLLSLSDVAELEGKSWAAVNKSIQRNRLKAIKVETNEKCGFEYRVYLEDLSDKAKRRYYASLKSDGLNAKSSMKGERFVDGIEALSDKQREDVAYWKGVIASWREYVSEFDLRATEMTEEFVRIHNLQNPDRAISSRTLWQKWKDFRDYGDVALADHRSSKSTGSSSKIHDIVWSVFLQWFLDENEPSVAHVYRLTCAWAKMKIPELLPLPSEHTFRRAVKRIPAPVIKFFRNGQKSFEDECLPYLTRQYDFIDSNDIWSADFHTLDLMVRDDVSGRVFRPHLITWIDIRSRKVLSFRLCESSNSDGVILSFRDGVKRFGVPRSVYLDNGREFLVHDFGGRGRRSSSDDLVYATTILERLGIEMVNAKVRNAKAKVIERSFRVVSEQFSKLYITYCGNNPVNRPQRHNDVLKDSSNIPLLSEVQEDLRVFLEGWYNEASSEAEGLNGISPNECYKMHLLSKRVASNDELNLMLSRSSRLQSVSRNGVLLRFGESKVSYYSEELVLNYFKEKVFVRYDTEDLSSVRVYDEDERFICVADRLEVGGYSSENDKASIVRMASRQKRMKGLVKEYLEENLGEFEAPDILEVMRETALRNMERSEDFSPNLIEPVVFNRGESLASAVGDFEGVVDLSRMIKNVRKNKGRED